MQCFFRLRCLCLAYVLHAVVGSDASAQLSQLVTRVPPTANAMLIVNAQAVRSGPMNHGAGMIALPASVQWYLLAAEMDFEYMQPLWEVAVAYLPEGLAMKDVAERSGGRLDRLAGSQAVERPNDSYVVSFGPRVVGAMSPANRQHVIRWVRESKVRKAAQFSPFLAEAVQVAGEGAANDVANQLVIAFDLTGLLAPAEVSFALASSQALADADVDVEQAAKIVAGIVGVRLEIELKDPPQARLWLAFEEDPLPLTEVAKPLLVEILTKRGARIELLPRWKVRSEQQAIVLEGQLSPGGLRRVLSLLSGPVGPWTTASGGATSPENVAAQASRDYFQSVTGYLNDLFFDNVRPQSMHQISVWVERYARKIEDLDATHVDPDVKSYATDVVMSLREIGLVVERSQMRSDLREATMYNSGRSRYGRYGAYGYFEKSYVTRDRELIQSDEALRGFRGSEVIVADLRALTTETRKTMTDRYGIDF